MNGPRVPRGAVDPVVLAIAVASVEAGAGHLGEGELDVDTRRSLAIADELGAPRGPVLRQAQVAAAQRRRLADEVRRASAEGRAVALGLTVAPPLLSLFVGALVGTGPGELLRTAPGRAVATVAAVAWSLGVLSVRRMVARAGRPEPPDPVVDVLVVAAVALRAGLPLPAALRVAADSVERDQSRRTARAGGGARRVALWLELGSARPPPVWPSLAPRLRDAAVAGVGLAGVLDEVAAGLRGEAAERARRRAARLPASLTVPTVLLLLPSGLLLVAGPVLLHTLALLR